MNKKQKRKKIKEWIKQGKIKPLGEKSFSVPSEAFILGITPRLISEVINKKKSISQKDKKVNPYGFDYAEEYLQNTHGLI